MKYTVDHDYHIHSCLSPCSGDPNQTPERILQYAKDNSYSSVCITDHFWDSAAVSEIGIPKFYQGLDYLHISKALPLPQGDGISFYFGCETEMLRTMKLGITSEVMQKLDFVVVPLNHFQMGNCVMPPDILGHPEKVAAFYTEKLNYFIDMDLPFEKIGLAHFTDYLTDRTDSTAHIKAIAAMKSSDLTDFFGKAAKKGIGIEFNIALSLYKDNSELQEILRPYRIASECGCKFYIGSDAHTVSELKKAHENSQKIVDLLGLCEDQKYHIPAMIK